MTQQKQEVKRIYACCQKISALPLTLKIILTPSCSHPDILQFSHFSSNERL